MPLVIGLVTLLMVSSAAVSQLIIRGLQASTRIEASNRAYLAAEAGLEDALYEITPHFAGYETPPLDDGAVRNTNFINSEPCSTGTADWCNEWEVESISGATEWSGRMYANQKLMIYLYNDTNYTGTNTNGINSGPFAATDIATINDTFSITFKIPEGIIPGSTGKLKIDNDRDYDGSLNTINEDPDEPVTQQAIENCPENPEDKDCDGKVNEDSEKDPVILWKMSDGAEKSLIPIRGCLSDSGAGNEKSELCEQDFRETNDFEFTLSDSAYGINENGDLEKISAFIDRASADTHSKLLFEFLIIAPMEHIHTPYINNPTQEERIELPYFEYTVNSSSDSLPRPYIQIKSDGYYRGFKQSITSTVTPKTTVPLFDFTIIQQE